MESSLNLSNLRAALDDASFPLALPDARSAAETARQIVTQLDDYVLPRLEHLDAPVLTVVGGSTGAGKSTLVNTVIGRRVSAPGVIRPTTRSPVVVINPADEHWFSPGRILPGLARVTQPTHDRTAIQLVFEPSLPAGLAILDAPDVDSVDKGNRELAAQLLDAADLWLFVTSAARYADAVPWGFLNQAAERGAAVAVVINRVPPEAMQVVPSDLGRMMSERGLADAPLFAVPETAPDDQGLLPDAAVTPIRGYLAQLASDNKARENVVRQTLQGAITSIVQRAPMVADALDAQTDASHQLAQDASASFDAAREAIQAGSSDGTLLHGEVMARWHDFVGTTDLMRSVDRGIGSLRDRIVGFFTGRTRQTEQINEAATDRLQALITDQGEQAVERAWSAWNANPAGRALLAEHPELRRPSEEFYVAAERMTRDWQSDVMELVRSEGAEKKDTARFASLGVTGVGAILIVLVFLSTGGITGAEGGIAVGTSVVAQRVLESIFGTEGVRRLTEQARQSLAVRVDALLDAEAARYTELIDSITTDDDRAATIRAIVAEITGEPAEVAEPVAALPATQTRDHDPAELTTRRQGDLDIVNAKIVEDGV